MGLVISSFGKKLFLSRLVIAALTRGCPTQWWAWVPVISPVVQMMRLLCI